MKANLVKEGKSSQVCIRTSERVSIVQVVPSGTIVDGSNGERLPDMLESVFECVEAIGYELSLSSAELTQIVLDAIAAKKAKR